MKSSEAPAWFSLPLSGSGRRTVEGSAFAQSDILQLQELQVPRLGRKREFLREIEHVPARRKPRSKRLFWRGLARDDDIWDGCSISPPQSCAYVRLRQIWGTSKPYNTHLSSASTTPPDATAASGGDPGASRRWGTLKVFLLSIRSTYLNSGTGNSLPG